MPASMCRTNRSGSKARLVLQFVSHCFLLMGVTGCLLGLLLIGSSFAQAKGHFAQPHTEHLALADAASGGIIAITPSTSTRTATISPTPTAIPECGLAWRAMPSPNNGASSNDLYGVAVVSANDVWAVGYYYDASPDLQILTEHWD